MMYRGEYYRMQCDAHMEFVKHWVSYVIVLVFCIPLHQFFVFAS